MKFGIRDLLLLVTWIAVLFWAFSSHSKPLGRQLLCASLAICAAVLAGDLGKHQFATRLRCAIGGVIGGAIYSCFAYFMMRRLFDVPVFYRLGPFFDADSIIAALSRKYWSELTWFMPLSAALGASVGPLFLIHSRRHKLSENHQTNRIISLVILGLIMLSYFLAAVDNRSPNSMDSNWMTVFLLLMLVFVLFTFSWTGEHFESLSDKATDSPSVEQPERAEY